VVLSGMNDEAQVEENIKTAETALPSSLSQDDLAVMSKVASSYRRLMKVPCTGCAYCMPCPNGVNIPSNFSIYNQYNMFDKKLYTRGMYAVMLKGILHGEPSDASLCKNCGACAKKCPQHIAIPDELKKVNGSLGGLQTKIMMPVIKKMAKKQFKAKLE
jgi:hypothetical protein